MLYYNITGTFYMLTRRHIAISALIAAATVSSGVLAQSSDRLKVVASFSVLGDLVKEIGGERVSLTTLVGPNADAHVYTATPADAKAMGAANVIVLNGLKFEGWIDRLIKSSGAKGSVVTATTGIVPLKSAGGDVHDHGAGVDPHAWQDIANVKHYVANIRDGLVAADTVGKGVYVANATRYLAQLDALDTEVKAAVARIPAANRKLITSHDAFGYFAKAYGIAFIAPTGVSTEAEASAKDVAKVIRQAKAERIKAIFMENITNPKLGEQIARETGAVVGGRIYSDALSAPDGPAGTYIAMMKHNIGLIAKALGAGAV
jgi:zinc/manganese transport system substrate-binding protein